MQKFTSGAFALGLAFSMAGVAWLHAQNMPRGTATDVSKAEIDATLQKSAAIAVKDQPLRLVSINGEYNIGLSAVHRARLEAHDTSVGVEHSQVTEIYHVISGTGTLVTGGIIENPKVASAQNGPSVSGGPVRGGVSRRIGPGDVVIIPPNTPHWFSEITSDQIVYLSVVVDPHKSLPAGYGPEYGVK